MFTGIVEAVGRVTRVSPRRLEVMCSLNDLGLGESVSVNGVCLTVAELTVDGFAADISEETARRTSVGDLSFGDPVNLERAMAADGRFGGHIVQGHVDGVIRVSRVAGLAGSVELWFELPGGLARYLVEKGSVTVEGVSLTVARLDDKEFSVSLVPHTLASTTLGSCKPGDRVNLEVDVLAKYVERLIEARVRR